MKFIQFFLIVGLCLVLSCINEDIPDSTYDSIPIENDQSVYNQVLDSQFIKSIRYVALETTKEGIIPSDPTQVIVTSNRIFIADYRSSTGVWIFNHEGKFLNKIIPLGEGPGEFQSARSITIDTINKKIEIFSDFKGAVLTYDLNGYFLKEDPVEFVYDSKLPLPNNLNYFQILATSMNNLNSEIIVAQKNKKPVGLFYKKEDESVLGMTMMKNSIFESEGKVFYYKAFCDTIYQLSDKKANICSVLNFKSNPIPKNFNEIVNKQGSDRLHLAFTNSHPFIRDYYYENSRYCYFTYMYKKETRFFLFDKASRKSLINSITTTCEPIGLNLFPPKYCLKNGVLFLQDYSHLQVMQSALKAEDKKKVSSELLNRYSKMKESDNPLLIFVEFN